MKTKLFSAMIMVAVVLICLIALPVGGNKAGVENLMFTRNGDSYTLVNCTETASGALTIPATYKGLPVTNLGASVFSGCSSLTSITIPGSVTSIEEQAFSNCTGLTNVTYCGTAEQWNEICIATDGNEALINAALSYHSYANGECTLCGAEDGIGSHEAVDGTWDNRGIWTLDEEGTLTISGTGAMQNNDYDTYGPWYDYRDYIRRVVIENGVTRIGVNAFYGCSNLTGVSIPDSVTCIADQAFYGCTSLRGIHIPESVERICTDVFRNCTALTSITIPNSISVIDIGTFYGCTALTDVSIPESVTRIRGFAFFGCGSLTEIAIPASVASIDECAFYDCKALKDVIFCGTEEQWGEVTIRSNNEYFVNATLSYHNYTEKECTICGDKVVYTITFKNWNGDVISSQTYYWGDTVTEPIPTREGDETYMFIFTGWDREVGVCTGNATYMATFVRQRRDGLLYSVENGQVTITGYAGNGGTLNIPGTIENLPVTGIGGSAFSGCTSLTGVTIPNSVVSIGENAFNSCTSIVKVVIPDSVAAIGHAAFLGTPWYTEKIAQSGEWLIVGDGVLLKYSGTSATEVTVPDSVKYISDAFRGNSKLVRINVKSTCKTIGQYAFADCPKLKIIGLPMKLDYIASNSVVGCPILQNIKNIDDNPATPETITPIETVPPVQAKPEGVTPASVKVMSWNIWHENVWTGQCTNWERLAKVIDVVEYFNPDVLMTQETTDWWCIYLMQNLPSQYTWAYTHSNGHDEAMPELNKNNKHADETHSAIFYNQEKLELLDNGLFWLSETPNVMSKYYESWCFRIVSWAKFRDKATGREFICIDVHLDDETDEPYKILMDFVTKNIETPTIMAGDFNRRSDEDIMKKLNTYTPLKDAANGTESKSNIDWVYVSRNTVEVLSYKHGVVEGIEKPSDHKPRVVELLIY